MNLRLLRILGGPAVVWLAASPLLRAADSVKLLPSASQESGRVMDGTILKMTPTEVVVKQAMVDETVAVNQIESIRFSEESMSLRQARTALQQGRCREALSHLGKVNLGEVERKEIKEEIAFTAAMARLRLAIASDVQGREAAQARIAKFLAGNPQTYHYFEICEALGELLAAEGKFDEAAKWYRELARAPWDDYRLRSAVDVGWTYLAAKRPAEALKQFEAVISDAAQGDLVDVQKLAAQTGKARCLAELRDTAAAVKFAKDLIARAESDDVETLARAYVALGRALQNAARGSDNSDQKKTANQQAVFAFLHVETLYATVPDAHAEALAGLIEVWSELRNRYRAHEVQTKLVDNYPGSPWAAPYVKRAKPSAAKQAETEEGEGEPEE